MKRRKTVSVLILLLVAILMLTGLSSCKDPEPEPLTDEEALRGQWAMYVVEEPDTGNQTGTETEVFKRPGQGRYSVWHSKWHRLYCMFNTHLFFVI